MRVYNFLTVNILSLIGNYTIFFSILIFYLYKNNVSFDPFIYIGYLFYYIILLFLLFPLWIIEKLLSKKYPQIIFLSKQNNIPLWYKIIFYIGLIISSICFTFCLIYIGIFLFVNYILL